MRRETRIFDDVARLAGGAVNIASAVGTQIRQEMRARADEAAERLDLVPREEIDRLECIVAELRAQQDNLRERLEKLEKPVTEK